MIAKLAHIAYSGLIVASSSIAFHDIINKIMLQQGVTVSTDWVGYGVGGAIAIVVIQWKRADDAEHAKKIGEYAKTLEAVNIRLDSSLSDSTEVIKGNTAAFASLEAAFKAMNQFEDIISKLNDLKLSRSWQDPEG